MGSATFTVDARPADFPSVRLEGRIDDANQPFYYAGEVATDDGGAPVPSASTQPTVTLGAVAWF